ncbi:MAG TPA: hypothetical protein VMG99_01505 [Thermoplasmata archaeon]|jgi:hypothetical protein|nr:hypothetical protein [Thermoplasmata archaeon]
MTNLTERTLAYGFGLLGGGLILLGAVVTFVFGAVDLLLGHAVSAANSVSLGVVLLVVGALVLLFAYLGHRDWSDRPLASGILLVTLAVIGWAFLGLGANVVALIGALFAFLGGLLFLIEPAKRIVTGPASA